MTFWVTLDAKGRFATTWSPAIFPSLFFVFYFSFSFIPSLCISTFENAHWARLISLLACSYILCPLFLMSLVPSYSFHRNRFKRRTSKWALRWLIAAVDMKRIEWFVTRREEGTKQGKKRNTLLLSTNISYLRGFILLKKQNEYILDTRYKRL